MHSAERCYHFGPFCLDVAGRQLTKHGTRLALGGRAFDVLVALLAREGRLVSKAELMDEVWPGIAVAEGNLTTQVLNLRKLLTQHDPGTAHIATDAGRGYRFVAPLVAPEAPDTPPEAHPAAARGDIAVPALRDQHNIPGELNSFIGRDVELQEMDKRLRQRALLTLVGSGGIGKTRCAMRLAHAALDRFADGAWLVELAPLHAGGLVAESLCRVLGIPVAGERPAGDVATAFLRQRNALLILDGCEHVLEATAQLAATILKHCPHVHMIVTSREKLGIAGETVYRVPSLPLPPARSGMTAEAAIQYDAVRLFVERACDAIGTYELTDEDAPAVVSICRRLDGVAMATELAAARLRMMKPAEIAGRLEDLFRLLTGGSKAALPRQQTLRATIDWSYALLSAAEQALLRRLSVFVDGFSLEGAVAVCGGNAVADYQLLDMLTALVDKSLVLADQSGAVTRYRMLAATRQYACEKLTESGEPSGMRRLAGYLATLFSRAEQNWGVTPTAAWLDEFGQEVENLRAAIDWAFAQPRPGATFAGVQGAGAPPGVNPLSDDEGDPAIGIALVAAAGSIAEEMSLLADMKRWTAAAMPHLSPATPKARAGWVLYWATRHRSVFGVRDLSDLRRRAIALFREAGDTLGLSCALRTAGIALARPGDASGEARDMLIEAEALLRPLGRSKDLASAIAQLSGFYYLNGDEARARDLSEEALEMRRSLGDRTGELVSYINIAEFTFMRGDIHGAIAYAMQAQRAARACQVQEVLATVLTNIANYLLYMDDLEGARAAALEALGLHRALGNQDYAIVCLEHLALAHALDGAAHHAARLFGYTDAYFTTTGQVRDRPEQIRCDRLRRTLDAAIPAVRQTQLREEGAQWSAERADAAALLPPVPMLPRGRERDAKVSLALT